jgi:hypothetical protein
MAGSEKVQLLSISLPPLLGENLEMSPVNKMIFFITREVFFISQKCMDSAVSFSIPAVFCIHISTLD